MRSRTRVRREMIEKKKKYLEVTKSHRAMFTLSLFLCIVPAFLHASPRPLCTVSPVYCFQPGEGDRKKHPSFTSPVETSRNFLLLLLLLFLSFFLLSLPFFPLPFFFFFFFLFRNNNFYHLLVRTAASDTFFQSVSFLAGDERNSWESLCSMRSVCGDSVDVGWDVNNTWTRHSGNYYTSTALASFRAGDRRRNDASKKKKKRGCKCFNKSTYFYEKFWLLFSRRSSPFFLSFFFFFRIKGKKKNLSFSKLAASKIVFFSFWNLFRDTYVETVLDNIHRRNGKWFFSFPFFYFILFYAISDAKLSESR